MKTIEEATSYTVQACLYLVHCSGKEIKAIWPKNKQDKHGVWKDSILYSKNRWCDLLDLEGVEPFTSVNLRGQVPVNSKKFMSLCGSGDPDPLDYFRKTNSI